MICILFVHAIVALTESEIKSDSFCTVSGLSQARKWSGNNILPGHRKVGLFTVPYFSKRSYMSIVECDGLPSLSLDMSETRESTKCPLLGGGGHGRQKMVQF